MSARVRGLLPLVAVLVAACSVTPETAVSPTPTTSPQATSSKTSAPPVEEHVEAGGDHAAAELHAEVECTAPNVAVAHLRWAPAPEPGREQVVQVTVHSFKPGDFDASDALDAGAAELAWTDLQGQAIHHWRVVTRHDDRWLASETATFQPPTCPADTQPTVAATPIPTSPRDTSEAPDDSEAPVAAREDEERAAHSLAAEVTCSQTETNQGLAHLSWAPAAPRGLEQRVDVTIFDFSSGSYESSEPLSGETASLTWDRVNGQAIHSWRVVTRHADGWVTSATSTFEGPTCPADGMGG